MMTAAHLCHAWRLGDLLAGLAELPRGMGHLGERQVSDLTLDGCRVTPGALFLACQGRAAHGLEQAEEAKRRGAVAILAERSEAWHDLSIARLSARLGLPVIGAPVSGAEGLSGLAARLADRFYGSPSRHLETIGVTGDDDSATLCHLLTQALGREGSCDLISGADAQTADDGAPPAVSVDALTLQRTMAESLARGRKTLVVALPGAALAGPKGAAPRFPCLVCTGFSPEVWSAASLERLAQSGLEWLVTSLDDPRQVAALEAVPPTVRIAGYSLDANRPRPTRCDLVLSATRVEPVTTGLRLGVDLVAGDRRRALALDIGLIGQANAANALALLALMSARGAPIEQTAQDLERTRGAPGRMESFGGADAPRVLVDSADTAVRIESALRCLGSHRFSRLITVVGCKSDCSRAERARLGAIAQSLSDTLILTDDNPGHEPSEQIIADILSGVDDRSRVIVEPRRSLAIRIAIARAGIRDAVLIAGKGTSTLQDMGDLKVHFSDRAQVVEALREWREGHH